MAAALLPISAHAHNGQLERTSSSALIELLSRRGRTTPSATIQRHCLEILATRRFRSAALLKRYHDALCFMRAFPATTLIARVAADELRVFERRVAGLSADQRWLLGDSGIVGTTVEHAYHIESALWLARHVPEDIDIAWSLIDDTTALDELLSHLVLHIEEDYFEGGGTTTRRWIRKARGAAAQTDLVWLLRQWRDRLPADVLAQAYAAAEIPIRWRVRGACTARTHNGLQPGRCHPRPGGMRRIRGSVARLVAEPLRTIQRLPAAPARAVIDVVTAALVARAREVYAIRHANIAEVYRAPVGCGVDIVVVGVQPDQRLGLETNYGFAILSNGVPVGYGGASTLFCQANTGINIFEEFRGSEAAYLFAQTLRTFATLFGCRHFVVNPFQFGGGNREAIDSGALWFYYRMGFRPGDPAIRMAAAREWRRLQARLGRRTPRDRLRALARCDLVLQLPGAKKTERFAESWLALCGEAATRRLAETGCAVRGAAVKRVSARIVERLGGSLRGWSRAERAGLGNLAPVMDLADVESWPASARRAALRLLRAKGAPQERGYARAMAAHGHLRAALRRLCVAREMSATRTGGER